MSGPGPGSRGLARVRHGCDGAPGGTIVGAGQATVARSHGHHARGAEVVDMKLEVVVVPVSATDTGLARAGQAARGAGEITTRLPGR